MSVEANFPRRIYSDPPVVEAIARLAFAAPIPWSMTTPGVLFERLRETYPSQPEARNVMQAGISTGGGGPSDSASFAITAGPQEIVFHNEARDRLFIVGPQGVSAHGLPPYEGWESLESRLFESFAQINDVVPPDVSLSGVAVRYINRIEIPEVGVSFPDYLTIAFQLPVGFPQNLTGFLDRAELVYPDGVARLAFTWASVQAPSGSSGFVLDLDLSASPSDGLDVGDSRALLADLKAKESQAFEGLIQDRLREMFHEQS